MDRRNNERLWTPDFSLPTYPLCGLIIPITYGRNLSFKIHHFVTYRQGPTSVIKGQTYLTPVGKRINPRGTGASGDGYHGGVGKRGRVRGATSKCVVLDDSINLSLRQECPCRICLWGLRAEESESEGALHSRSHQPQNNSNPVSLILFPHSTHPPDPLLIKQMNQMLYLKAPNLTFSI